MKQIQIIKAKFDQYRLPVVLVILSTLPIKLSWTYVVLYPSLIIWLTLYPKECIDTFNKTKPVSSSFATFIIVALLSSCFGVDPLESFGDLVKLGIISTTALFLFASTTTRQAPTLLFVLCSAQGVAALHTIADNSYEGDFSGFLHGAVTESGQLALVIPLSFYLLYCAIKRSDRRGSIFTISVASMLLLALFLNLKRGPMAGVLFAGSYFFLSISLPLLLGFLTLGGATLYLYKPLHERIIYSYQHFFISGGRGEIWEIGADLFTRYPLGIGFQNSSFLNFFSETIPQNLSHFHNNILNVFVETGWIGGAVYLLFFYTLYSLCYHEGKNVSLLDRALLASLIAWQIAGLVEYNFGDSEVFIIAMCVLGILLRSRRADASAL